MNAPLNPGRSPNAVQPKPYTRGVTTARTQSITGSRNPTSGISPGHQASPRGLELVSEVDDLAVGIGMLTVALAPFALPGLALVALTMAVLMIPALGIALLLAPFLVARRCWRSRDRPSAADRLACLGEDDPGYEGGPPELVLRGLGV
jgi:hypothetical protein